MHEVKISGRQIFLDGKMLKGVQECQLTSYANEKLAELTLKMKVVISENVLNEKVTQSQITANEKEIKITAPIVEINADYGDDND